MNKFYSLPKRIMLFLTAVVLTGINTMGQNQVGALPGTIDVSPSGAATYSIPIEVVPGTQGIQPNLSVVYNSQSSNGLLGWKWDLAGLSSISRTGQTLYHDRNVTGIQYDNTDRFILDGNRLIALNANGADGCNYDTEIKTFSKITSHGNINNGPEYFTVIGEDGIVMEYGSSDDSRLTLAGLTSVWMIHKITDIHGNYMTFSYMKNDGGYPYIQKIEYTGNEAAKLKPYATVSFVYKTNTATQNDYLYIGGHWYKKTLLLQKIEIYYSSTISLSATTSSLSSATSSFSLATSSLTTSSFSFSSLVRSYLFEYSQNSRYARLSTIRLEGANSEYLNPTTILWGEESAQAAITNITNPIDGVGLVGDFNGDGISDLLRYNISLGSEYKWYQRKYELFLGDALGNYKKEKEGNMGFTGNAHAADLNGDGKDEFVYMNQDGYIYYNSFNKNTMDVGRGSSFLLGDFNGDGSVDVLFTKPDDENSQTIHLWTYPNTTSLFYPFPILTTSHLYTCDFNGNGKTDLVYTFDSKRDDNTHLIMEYNASNTYKLSIIHNSGFPTIWHQCYFGDFNGDGISDILSYTSNPDYRWEIHLSKGKDDYAWPGSSKLPLVHLLKDGNSYDPYRYQPLIADFDGDGKDDIAQIETTQQDQYMMKSRLRVYFTRTINKGEYTYESTLIENSNFTSSIVDYRCGDFNHDGKMDILYQNKFFVSFYANGESRLVKKITDGMGVETELDYTYFTYDKKSIRNRIPYPVVKELRQSNGLGNGKNITNFAYGDPYFNYKRRAFLGFELFQVQKDGITTLYEFHKNDQNYKQYETMGLYGITKYPSTGSSSFDAFEQQIINTQFLSFGDKSYLPYNAVTVIGDLLNNNWNYTERYLYTRGSYKGRDSVIITGIKSTMGIDKPYLIKQTKKILYKDFTKNGNKIVLPNTVISTEQIQGSDLKKSHTTVYSYDPDTIVLRIISQNNDHESIWKEFENHNAFGLPCLVKEKNTNNEYINVQYLYDKTGRFTENEITQGTDLVIYDYDRKTGNILWVIDINGLRTSYQYDWLGRKIKTIYPDGTRDSIVYTRGAIPDITNSAYHINIYSTGKPKHYAFYDKLGRELVKGDLSIKSFMKTCYNYKGQVVKVSYPYDHFNDTNDSQKTWKTYAYDIYGRIIEEKGFYLNMHYCYGQRSITVTDNIKNVSYYKYYDAASRLISSTDPGGTINYSYSLENYEGKTCNKTQISAFGNTTTIITDQSGKRLRLDDPDAGVITTTYHEFGYMLTQTDANGTKSTYTYDNFGRVLQHKMLTNDNNTTTITYTYDANNKKGTLSSETVQPDNTSISYTYDNLMRLKGKTYKNITDNQELSYSYSYNTIGQLDTVVYPFGFAIKHEYDSDGRLSTIKRVGNSSCLYDMYYYTKWNTPHLWRSGNMLTVLYHNQAGLPLTKIVGKGGTFLSDNNGGVANIRTTTQNSTISLGIGIASVGGISTSSNGGNTASAQNITLNGSTTTSPTGIGYFGLKDSSIQYFQYGYDNTGRISYIDRNPAYNQNLITYNGRELYKYDNMDRLLSAEKWTQNPVGAYGQIIRDTFFTMSYNKNLIKSNSTIGNYTYNHPSKPHALTQVEPFDETTISANTCDLTYTAFNKVKTISEGDYFYDIKYYPNKHKAITTLKGNGTIISQKQYAGKAFEIDYATNTKYFYVYAHGQPIAVFIQQGENAIQPYFIHTDYIGSIDKITDKDGNVVDSMSFDAWGNRRDRNNWQLREGNVVHLIDRGFTMHQHLDVFNLINMGGRVYDPDVQQFLSPDPYVQMPDNTQNLNRYAYCLNSPTMYVDPSGEWVHIVIGAAIGGIVNLMANAENINNFWQGVAYFGIGALAGAASAGIGAGVSSAIAGTGFGAGFLGLSMAGTSTGFLSGVAVGGSSAAVSGFTTGFGNGLVQGQNFIQSMENGAKQGLISAGIGALTGGIIGGLDALSSNKNVWTGKDIGMGRSPFAFNNSDMPYTGYFIDKDLGITDYTSERNVDNIIKAINKGKEGTYEDRWLGTDTEMGINIKTGNPVDIYNKSRKIWVGNAKGRLALEYYGYVESGYQLNISFDGVNALSLNYRYGGYPNNVIYVPSGTKYVNIQLIGEGNPAGTTFMFFSRIRGINRW